MRTSKYQIMKLSLLLFVAFIISKTGKWVESLPLYPLKILCNYTFLPEGQIQIVKGRGSHDDVDCGRCKFPFAYKGKLYSSCAVSAQGTDQEFTFCATEVSGRGSQYPQPTAFQDCRDSKTGIQHFCQTGTNPTVPASVALWERILCIVKLRRGSGKDRQGMAVKAKGLKA